MSMLIGITVSEKKSDLKGIITDKVSIDGNTHYLVFLSDDTVIYPTFKKLFRLFIVDLKYKDLTE